MTSSAAPLLDVDRISVGYGAVSVVEELSLRVDRGQVVALLGPNGAGKTTTLLSISGALKLRSGDIRFDGEPVTAPLHQRARRGLGLITEQRGIFKQLTAADNCRVGGVEPTAIVAMFPELAPRMHVKAGLLSGGQQQMLAVGRALSREARLLLIDELSLGLAPMVVERLLQVVRDTADRGVGVLLVEQHVRKVLAVADYVYVLQRGRVHREGTAAAMSANLEAIEASYFAASASS